MANGMYVEEICEVFIHFILKEAASLPFLLSYFPFTGTQHGCGEKLQPWDEGSILGS